MRGQAGKLSARAVATVTKRGRHADGGNLYLNVSRTGAKSWTLVWKKDGKRREMGLGSLSAVSLAKAREKAANCREILADGKDPLKARQQTRTIPTFAEASDALIASMAPSWRNAKHKAQWRLTLSDAYCAKLRGKAVHEIDTEDVLAVLKPIWQAKPETASRVRGRIEAVISWAKARGHRSGENPAAWRGHLDKLLPKRRALSRGHHAAMPYDAVPAFVSKLRGREGIAALALEFLILTGTRSGEVRGAVWSEFDLSAGVWTIPARRMKSAREHRVPLSGTACEIVARLAEIRAAGPYVFTGHQPSKPLSTTAMSALLRRMGVNTTVHGFRSAFRDWAGNETHFPREVAEAALAHVVGDKAELAYRRSDALEKRRALMMAWANHCEPETSSKVVRIARVPRRDG
jgi:integrase